jgi:membrane protein DedA with SNARE-associated domain
VLAELYMALWIMGGLFITGLGIPPVPEELGIIGAAVLAGSGRVTSWLAWPACVVGIVLADIVLYAIGRFGGQRVFASKLMQRVLPPKRYAKIADGFHRHGFKVLLTGRLVPGVRSGVFITAGAIHYPLAKFMIADAVYALPLTGLIYTVSYFSADTVKDIVANVHHVGNWVLLFGLLALAAFGVYKYIRFVHKRAATEDIEPPAVKEAVKELVVPEVGAQAIAHTAAAVTSAVKGLIVHEKAHHAPAAEAPPAPGPTPPPAPVPAEQATPSRAGS